MPVNSRHGGQQLEEQHRRLYLRVRDHLVDRILDGEFNDGDMLPSVRSLAAYLEANPLTVAKSYQTLQQDRVVEMRRGVGMFMPRNGTERLRRIERARFVREKWPGIACEIRRLQIQRSELTEATKPNGNAKQTP